MTTKKVFLAGPFKSLVDVNTGLMSLYEREKLESLISFFENEGWLVHNAHKREGWGKDFMTPQQCTKIDFDEIRSCDLFVAFPGSPASPGTHIEIGWASALKKKIVLLLENERDYAFLIQGLSVVADVEYINFKGTDDLLEKIKSILMEYKVES
ncbi:nucleoside 2-deoxyribosyltransferase [Bacillus vallismortis]|uniref:nucleoside 2-deoxyribosyltransferase n=1 Tax=Bacillus vallismortis TaxID=72361 RepID=UPI002DDD4D42|nr:nucleoside 2-deoxyribosyltransferase [Bacillus vallismortis]